MIVSPLHEAQAARGLPAKGAARPAVLRWLLLVTTLLRTLLLISGLFNRTIGRRITCLQRGVNRRLPRNYTCNCLADHRAKRLELRNADKLHAGVRNLCADESFG